MIGIGDTIHDILNDPSAFNITQQFKSYNILTKSKHKIINDEKPDNCFVFMTDGGSYHDY